MQTIDRRREERRSELRGYGADRRGSNSPVFFGQERRREQRRERDRRTSDRRTVLGP
jgi:hypothetical protein